MNKAPTLGASNSGAPGNMGAMVFTPGGPMSGTTPPIMKGMMPMQAPSALGPKECKHCEEEDAVHI